MSYGEDMPETTAETVLAAFPELRDTDYGRYLDSLTRDAERWYQEFKQHDTGPRTEVTAATDPPPESSWPPPDIHTEG